MNKPNEIISKRVYNTRSGWAYSIKYRQGINGLEMNMHKGSHVDREHAMQQMEMQAWAIANAWHLVGTPAYAEALYSNPYLQD